MGERCTSQKQHLYSLPSFLTCFPSPHRYARLGLARVGLPPGLGLDPERVEAMLKQQGRVVVFFSLSLLLAPVVETLVLLDRMIYLQENGELSLLHLPTPHLQLRLCVSPCRCGQPAGSPFQPQFFPKKFCAGGSETEEKRPRLTEFVQTLCLILRLDERVLDFQFLLFGF